MAKRRRKSDSDGSISEKMRKHLTALQLASPEDYLGWCVDHGFDASIEKTRDEIYEELAAFRRDLDRAEAQTKIHRNPKQFIKQVCAGTIRPEQITRPAWHEFCRSVQASKTDEAARRSLSALLVAVDEKAGFLFDNTTFGGRTYPFVDGLIRLNDRRGQWIRPLDDWRPETHNHHRQFSSLARHLLARYSVPRFMDSAWFQGGKGAYRQRDWFVHIGSGKNIRAAKTPVPLTKRMAHHFLEAPDGYSIEHAIRWGQTHASGGDRRLTEALLGTQLGDGFENDDFWMSVIRFLVANPMLDRRHVGSIVDYLRHQKFETREVLVGPGRIETEEPPQPNLTMRGRTADSLLRQVESWHRELGRSRAAERHFFRRSGIQDFELATGKGKKSTWRVRELLSGAELIAEGRAMRHCVSSYAASCAIGRCSIWAMELQTPTGLEKRQTVEVTDHGLIVQCRGKQNRLPTPAEYEVLAQWARAAGLSISSYLETNY